MSTASRLAAGRFWVVDRSFDDFHVREVVGRDARAEAAEHVGADVPNGIDLPLLADSLGEANSEKPVAGTEVRDNGARLDTHGLEDILDLLPLFAAVFVVWLG